MGRPCITCTTLGVRDLQACNRALKAGEQVAVVARRFNIHPSAMQRHAWNHVEQGRFLRDIKISADDERSAFDQIASLADSLASAEAVRIAAIRRGQGHLALRAAQTERQLSKALFADLGIDSRDVAEHLRQANHLGRAVFRLIRTEPDTGQRLLALLDPASEVAHDLEIFLHDLTTEEPAA